MRVIVFFDLPVKTSKEKRNYRNFRKFLTKSGFIMVQYSVYSKLTLNANIAESIILSVLENRPIEGLVQMMVITEKQYSKMILVTGEEQSVYLDDDKRLVIF